MTDRHSSDVLGGLPNSRPHRRSDKRAARASVSDAADQKVEKTAPEGATSAKATAPSSKATPPSSKANAPSSKANASSSKARATAARPRASSKQKTAAAPRTTAKKASSRPRISQPAQPGGTPRTPRASQPEPSDRPDILGTAVQAAAELAEIGLMVGARALRGVMSRIPRP